MYKPHWRKMVDCYLSKGSTGTFLHLHKGNEEIVLRFPLSAKGVETGLKELHAVFDDMRAIDKMSL